MNEITKLLKLCREQYPDATAHIIQEMCWQCKLRTEPCLRPPVTESGLKCSQYIPDPSEQVTEVIWRREGTEIKRWQL